MLHRAERCKPTTVFGAVSALAQFGIRHGFVLPTQRFDGDALFYRQIYNFTQFSWMAPIAMFLKKI